MINLLDIGFVFLLGVLICVGVILTEYSAFSEDFQVRHIVGIAISFIILAGLWVLPTLVITSKTKEIYISNYEIVPIHNNYLLEYREYTTLLSREEKVYKLYYTDKEQENVRKLDLAVDTDYRVVKDADKAELLDKETRQIWHNFYIPVHHEYSVFVPTED